MQDAETGQKLVAVVDGLKSRIEKGIIGKYQNQAPSVDDMSVFTEEETGLKIGALAINEGKEVVISILDWGKSSLQRELAEIQFGITPSTIVVLMSPLDEEDRGMAMVDASIVTRGHGLPGTATSTRTAVKPDYTLKIMGHIPKE